MAGPGSLILDGPRAVSAAGPWQAQKVAGLETVQNISEAETGCQNMVARHDKKEWVVGRTERAFPPDEFVTPCRGRCKDLAGIGRVAARWGRYYARWRRHDGQIVMGRKRVIVADDKSR